MKFNKTSIEILSLAVVQGWNALTAIIILPKALIGLGAEAYATFALAESIVMLLVPLVVYSYDFYGVKVVASQKTPADSLCAVRNFFPVAIYSKALLSLLVSVVLVLLTVFVFPLKLQYLPPLLLILVGAALQQNWLFLSLRRNFALAVCITLVRGPLLVVLWMYLSDYSHGGVFAFLYGVMYAAAGLASTIYAVVVYKLKIRPPGFAAIGGSLRSGFTVFLSGFSVSFYRGTGVFFLTVFGASSEAVSIYSLFEKFAKAIQATTRPISQYFYPRIVELSVNDGNFQRNGFKLYYKFIVPQLAFLLTLWVLFVAGFSWLSEYYLRSWLTLPQSIIALALGSMLFANVFGCLNFSLGTGVLNALGREKELLKSVGVTAVASLGVSVLSIYSFSEAGAFFAFAFGEVLLFAIIALRLSRATHSQSGDER